MVCAYVYITFSLRGHLRGPVSVTIQFCVHFFNLCARYKFSFIDRSCEVTDIPVTRVFLCFLHDKRDICMNLRRPVESISKKKKQGFDMQVQSVVIW